MAGWRQVKYDPTMPPQQPDLTDHDACAALLGNHSPVMDKIITGNVLNDRLKYTLGDAGQDPMLELYLYEGVSGSAEIALVLDRTLMRIPLGGSPPNGIPQRDWWVITVGLTKTPPNGATSAFYYNLIKSELKNKKQKYALLWHAAKKDSQAEINDLQDGITPDGIAYQMLQDEASFEFDTDPSKARAEHSYAHYKSFLESQPEYKNKPYVRSVMFKFK